MILLLGLWVRGTESALCIACWEAASVEVWERVPWCSKSFSPRRGKETWEFAELGRVVRVGILEGLEVVYYLLGEGGKETEILGLIRRIGVCGIRGAYCRVFVYVRHVRRMTVCIEGYLARHTQSRYLPYLKAP